MVDQEEIEDTKKIPEAYRVTPPNCANTISQ